MGNRREGLVSHSPRPRQFLTPRPFSKTSWGKSINNPRKQTNYHRRRPNTGSLICIWLISCAPIFGSTSSASTIISGKVVDPSGRPIVGAQVLLRLDNNPDERQVTTNSAGEFSFDVSAFNRAQLTAAQKGFAPSSVSLGAAENTGFVEIRLSVAGLSDAVVVTATRGGRPLRVADSPASISAIEGDNFISSAEQTVDDVLRARVAGFSLFRRTSSLAANPTTQGVSLRATGSSGASRTAVMDDGVPAGDPFGGWIYWSRFPRARISDVEVVRGSLSDEYGSSAIGGVIGFEPRVISPRTIVADFSLGTLHSADFSLFAAHATRDSTQTAGAWGASVAVDTATTDGYIPVASGERGSVDEAAGGWHRTVEVTLERKFSEGGFFASGSRLFVRGQLFGEHRQNGTPLQRNSTASRLIVLGGESTDRYGDAWRLRIFGGTQGYDQTFSSIDASRTREALTRLQRVPARQMGGSLLWSRIFLSKVAASAGMEGRQVRGFSDEIIYDTAGRRSTNTVAGGVQDNLAAMASVEFFASAKLRITGSGRLDSWRNRDGSSSSRSLLANTAARATLFPSRSETAFSPRLSAVFVADTHLSFRASVGRSFRAPTLNELYRDFRVGNILTQGNSALKSERSTTGEAGALWASGQGRLALRGTVFLTMLNDPIANITLSETAALITRQRKNLGRTRSRGVEAEAELRPNSAWTFSSSYLLADARVRVFPADASLVGLSLPQIPRHSLTFQAQRASQHFVNIGLAARYNSDAFEDDRNALRLGSYKVFDIYVSRPIRSGVEVYAAVENLFDRNYATGRTPATTVGTPRTIRMGVNFRSPFR
ncbi:MAG TPA: TonB-dependent receptor [Acidobacteriota bacterium]